MADYILHPITWKNVIDYNWLQLQITITPCLIHAVKNIRSMRPYSKQRMLQMSTRGDQTCLNYSIDHQTYVDYSIEHQTSVVNSMDTSNFGSLQHRPTKLMFFTVRQFHSYQYNLQPFEKHRSLLSTFSMLRYIEVMYLCATDIYFASFYDF
jgi:hypothetical protein